MGKTMKMKYYLRGLATGIVIAAILMALSSGGKKDLSDKEIKERAAAMGMVMPDTTLASVEKTLQRDEEESGETVVAESKTEETQESVNEAEEIQQTESKVEETQQAGSNAEEDQESGNRTEELQHSENKEEVLEFGNRTEEAQQAESKAEEAGQDGNAEEAAAVAGNEDKSVVTIVIRAGNSSDTVAKMLMSAGLVENASEYDTYLCSKGYDKKICVGTFEIPKGSTEEEIAEIITKRR